MYAAEDVRLVGQERWARLVPLLHTTLAAPSAVHVWPRGNERLGLNVHAYWDTALYLLGVLLGWDDVGLGLRRVYEAHELDSPHLELLSLIWNTDSQLDAFAMWAWEQRASGRHGFGTLGEPRRPEDFLGREWHNDFLRRYPPTMTTESPYHGGTNPLHLGHSLGAFHDTPARAELLQVSSIERRAVLLVDVAVGWATALEQVDLPPIGDRSWKVDVVVRPLGWMGTFRKSRVTGRWFVGKHSTHMMGFE